MPALRLLFVGRRSAALEAAERLGAEVLLLEEAAASFDDPAACVQAARRILDGHRPDAVVALVERAVVPAAAIRAALDVDGARPERAILWRDKVAMKARVREAGLPCAAVCEIGSTTRAEELVEALGLPLVIKPRRASGGRGAVIAHSAAEVAASLREGWIAESFVRGVELSVESFVQGGALRFTNVTEYLEPGWACIVPADLPPPVARAVHALNRRAIEALEIEDGLTHLEAFVVDDGDREPTVVFGELACRPPGGAIMELMARAYGFDPWASHLAVELGRPLAFPKAASRCAGVWFLHPGPGRVVTVEGLEDARGVPHITAVECRLAPGDEVAVREGTGQNKGRILAEAQTRDEVAGALEEALARIRITMAR